MANFRLTSYQLLAALVAYATVTTLHDHGIRLMIEAYTTVLLCETDAWLSRFLMGALLCEVLAHHSRVFGLRIQDLILDLLVAFRVLELKKFLLLGLVLLGRLLSRMLASQILMNLLFIHEVSRSLLAFV